MKTEQEIKDRVLGFRQTAELRAIKHDYSDAYYYDTWTKALEWVLEE